jgi:hypothetical protein
MFEYLLNNAIPSEILSTRGDMVRFGIRIRIFPYPEGVRAVWVMLAVKFRQSSFQRD